MAGRNNRKQLFYRVGAGILAALMLFGAVYTTIQFIF